MSKDEKNELKTDPDLPTTLIGAAVLFAIAAAVATALLFSPTAESAENVLAEPVAIEVPFAAADDATATAGTLILSDPTGPAEETRAEKFAKMYDPASDNSGLTTSDNSGRTTFFGQIGDSVCEFTVELGDTWDIEFVKNFTRDHPCDVVITK